MYRLFLRSCKLPGVVVIPPLPPMLLEPLPSAGSLGSTDIAPLHRYFGPLQLPLVFRRLPGVSGYTASCSGDFSPGRGGSLQLLSMPWSSCCRFNPARMQPPRQPGCDDPCCLHPAATGSASGASPFRGHTCVHFRYGPMTRSPSLRWLCR